MDIPEKKLITALVDLKENYNVIGTKAEFENEGTLFEEARKLQEISTKAGLDLTIKIGGCGAVRDISEAKIIGAKSVVAPMIETAYAGEKYIQSINSVYSQDDIKNTNFLINIETVTGYKNLEEIDSSPYFKEISGVVLGRTDMAGSMYLPREEINSLQIFNMANKISKKMQENNKIFITGGGISEQSVSFLKKLHYLSGFETRKIIFDKSALNNPNIGKGILKALDFELIWLENMRINPSEGDKSRICMLKNICCRENMYA